MPKVIFDCKFAVLVIWWVKIVLDKRDGKRVSRVKDKQFRWWVQFSSMDELSLDDLNRWKRYFIAEEKEKRVKRIIKFWNKLMKVFFLRWFGVCSGNLISPKNGKFLLGLFGSTTMVMCTNFYCDSFLHNKISPAGLFHSVESNPKARNKN